MQFQSDISGSHVAVPADEELSGIGAAYMAGIASGLYDDAVFDMLRYTEYAPQMAAADKRRKITAWKKAVKAVVKK
jgi:glycerol kinase